MARAILKDAPILILDEPTSAVDIKTEAEIMFSTEALMRGRTTFMIAHRLSTLRNCDLLLRLENGGMLIEQSARPDFHISESAQHVVPAEIYRSPALATAAHD